MVSKCKKHPNDSMCESRLTIYRQIVFTALEINSQKFPPWRSFILHDRQ